MPSVRERVTYAPLSRHPGTPTPPMIDSLLFLPDVDGATVDVPTDHIPRDDEGDAAAAAAVAASRDGHAHAARAAWAPAAAALERSAIARDALVSEGLAGPLVATRGWSDLATVQAASGDLDGARLAYARATGAAHGVATVPDDLRAALADLDATLGAVTPVRAGVAVGPTPPAGAALPALSTPARAADAGDAGMIGDLADGLLWLDTTDDGVIGEPPSTADTAPEPSTAEPDAAKPSAATSTGAGNSPTRTPPARIAAVDAAVALASNDDTPPSATGGLAARLRRFLRR